jgi:hypothetical protein
MALSALKCSPKPEQTSTLNIMLTFHPAFDSRQGTVQLQSLLLSEVPMLAGTADKKAL